MGKVPLQVLKELEHQATINFTATFAKTVSTCNTTMRSVRTVLNQPSKGLKARFRRVPILKKLPGVAMKIPVTILKC